MDNIRGIIFKNIPNILDKCFIFRGFIKMNDIDKADIENIKNQWVNYLNKIHYNKFLKLKEEKLMNELINKTDKIEELQNIKKILDVTEHEHIFNITGFNKENKEVFLFNSKYIKKNFFEKLGIFKFDGYVLYINKAEELHIYKIKNLKFLYSLFHEKEKYVLNRKIGTFQGKPFLLIKYPIPISLDINIKNENLFYDAKSFYNYMDYATKGNLTDIDSSNNNFFGFVSKNIWVILIILIIGAILLVPELREYIINFIKNAPQK
jgi:hypothetical protein